MPADQDEVELINPQVEGEALERLRAYRRKDWFDAAGNWHVVLSSQHLLAVMKAERKRRSTAGRQRPPTEGDFLATFEKALAKAETDKPPDT